jgi:hypothetical protein
MTFPTETGLTEPVVVDVEAADRGRVELSGDKGGHWPWFILIFIESNSE